MCSFPGSSVGLRTSLQCKRPWFSSCVRKFPWRRDKLPIPIFLGFPGGSDGKESACNVEDLHSIPDLEKSPWRREWQPTPVFLPGESHGQRSPVGYSPRGSQRVSPWLWGVLHIPGWLAAIPFSTYSTPGSPLFSRCADEKCLWTLPRVPWGAKPLQLRTVAVGSTGWEVRGRVVLLR